MTRAVLLALASHWRRRPLQLGTLLVGLMLATALWTGVQAVNAEARASYAEASDALGQSELPVIDGPLTVDEYVALRRAGWRVTPVVEGRLRAGDLSLDLAGFEPLTAPPGAVPRDFGADGVPLAAPPLLLGAEAFAALEGTAEGARLGPLRLSAALGPDEAATDVGRAMDLLGRATLDRVAVLPGGSLNRPPLEEVLPGRAVRQPDDSGDVVRLTRSFHLNLTAFGLLSFAVGLFIVHAAIGLAFEQRRPVMRTLRALGVPARRLVALVAAEMTALALIAGAAGVLLGWAIAAALLPGVAATLSGLYGADVEGGLQLRASWALAGLGIAVLGTWAASARALWGLATLPVLQAGQPRAWAMASARRLRWQALGAAALLAAGALAGALGTGIGAGFAALGGLLLGSALLLPPVLAVALRLAEGRARGPLLQWFLADTRQQLPGLSMALMALMLALAANIGVGTMVGSFRGTFTGWLDQRLASELYVSAASEAQASRVVTLLAARPDVSAVLPIWSVETRIGGLPGDLFALRDHATYRDHWPLLSAAPDVWDAVAEGRAVLLNEQTARRMDLGVGDAVEVAPGWTAAVAGVYSDYGNPRAQALVGEEALGARYPDAPRLRFGIRTDDPEAVADALAAAGVSRAGIVDQASIKALSLSIFETTFAVTGVLNVLTLAVAGFAMLAALLTLAAMRLPQLAPVWALGLTRRRLARLELLRTVMLALGTALLALPVGLVLAWTLLAVVNVQAFGWRLPMDVFPGEWAVLIGAAALAAALAAAWPARRLAVLPPRALLEVFASER